MSRDNGFLQLRRGLWEHIRDGRMSITEALTFIYICSEADTRSGIWKGCGKSLSGELGIPERTARDVLERLEHGDYIRRFAVPGRHSCYPILVHKFSITQGEHDGEQLNALDSVSPTDLAYFSCEQDGERNGEHGAAQRISKNREKRKEPAAKTPRPPDPRHQPFFELAYKAFQTKHGRPPIWGARDGKALKNFLGEHESVLAEQWVRRFNSYLQSTDQFIARKQGHSLRYFVEHFDSFADGPIWEKGKLDANDSLARTIKNSGLDVNGHIVN